MSKKQLVLDIKRRDLDAIRGDLGKLKSIRGTKVAFAVISINNEFNSNMALIKEKQVPNDTPEVLAYREEVQKFYDDSLIKDDKGKVLYDGNGKVRLKDQNAFNAGVMKILDEHPVAKGEIEAHEKAYNEFIEEDIKFTYDSLELDELPTDLDVEELVLLQKYWNNLLPTAGKKLQK